MTITTEKSGSTYAASYLSSGYTDSLNKNDYDDNIMSYGLAVLGQFMQLTSELANDRFAQMSARADRARESQQKANEIDAIISKMNSADSKGDLPPDVIEYMRKHNIPVTTSTADELKNKLNELKNKIEEDKKEIQEYEKSPIYPLISEKLKAKLEDDEKTLAKLTASGNQSDIDAYLASIGHPDGKGLDKGQLDLIKSALETDSGRSSDFVTQSQLKIQKDMQSYNVIVSLVNSMQTLQAEMNKAIAQNIR